MKALSPAVSYWVAKDWELPAEICKALAEQVALQPGNQVSAYAHILYQANMAAEIYVTINPQNDALVKTVLRQLNLPENLFETLDKLSRDV